MWRYMEINQKHSLPAEREQADTWKEKVGAVTKYYLVKTFVDSTHSCFRYTKIIYNKNKIIYHIWEAGYLAD